jgi:hypothetical protein
MSDSCSSSNLRVLGSTPRAAVRKQFTSRLPIILNFGSVVGVGNTQEDADRDAIRKLREKQLFILKAIDQAETLAEGGG